MEEKRNYLVILIATMESKLSLLEKILERTKKQEEVLKETTVNIEDLEQTFKEKEELIHQVNQLDVGFEQLYERVKGDLATNKEQYQGDILRLRELIRKVTDYNVQLQAIEQNNKARVEMYFRTRREEVKQLKMGHKTAVNYYRNMTQQNQNQSFFLDKKK